MRTQGLAAPPTTEPRCDDPAGWLCDRVLVATDGNETLARAADWVVGKPLTVLLILIGGWVVAKLARRAVRRLVFKTVTSTRSLSTLPSTWSAPDADDVRQTLRRLGGEYGHAGDAPPIAGEADTDAPDTLADTDAAHGDPPVSEADDLDTPDSEDAWRAGRAESIAGVLGSTAVVAVWTITILMAIGALGVPLAPLIAGAGIGGIALGFGAQSLVKDVISGLFMLLEDQYGVGDVVDLGEAVGAVERITLRATVLRSIDGTVWHVPNGEIRRVGNKSQRWSVALVDVDVGYATDLRNAQDVIARTAEEVCSRAELAPSILDAPEVLGIEHLGMDGITVRTVVQTRPGDQWGVQRALRSALKQALDEAGIEIPFPQRTVWLRNEPD